MTNNFKTFIMSDNKRSKPNHEDALPNLTCTPPRQVDDVNQREGEEERITNTTAGSLQDICIEYVARNIVMVESLVNFPDIVGREIFTAVESKGLLENWQNDKNVERIFKLFTESYRDCVMSELNLSNFPRLMLEECLRLLSQFVYLKKLDVSDQQLGDDHELWKTIGQMANLSHLSLKNNLLSNRGLQHLTLPCRMYKRGPVNLQVLSLACNPAVTDVGVKYLMCFSQLQQLDLSGTRVKCLGLNQLEGKLSLGVPVKSDLNEEIFTLRDNSGWASDTVNNWIIKYKIDKYITDEENRDENSGSYLTTTNFYGKKNSRRQLARVIRAQYPRIPCPKGEPHLILVSLHTNCTKKNFSPTPERKGKVSQSRQGYDLTGHDNEIECSELERQYLSRSQCDVLRTETMATKSENQTSQSGNPMNVNRQNVRIPDHFDDDMLSGYKKGSSLWSAMNSGQW